MGMKIGTEDSDLDTPVSGAGGRNETVDLWRLKGRERRRVKVKEHGRLRLRLGLLNSGYGVSNLRGSCGIGGAGDRRGSLGEFEGVQNLIQGLIEIRYGNFGLSINAGDKIRRGSKSIERRLWR